MVSLEKGFTFTNPEQHSIPAEQATLKNTSMLKTFLRASAFIVLLASCSAVKPIGITNRKQAANSNEDSKKDIKFLDISSDDDKSGEATSTVNEEHLSKPKPAVSTEDNADNTSSSVRVEKNSSIQIKYSQLLNTDADQIQNLALYQTIDDWYGTRYRLGGTTKNGIDCSAFVQTVYASAFGINLPRMAKDQYKATRRISRTKLREGDLLFFNTRGGVSHVGIYLQNNKFVHASVAGVMISDMFEPYYVKHFISAGRVVALESNSSALVNP